MANTTVKPYRHSFALFLLATAAAFLPAGSCKREAKQDSNKVAVYPSTVLDKWITLQLRLMRNATGIPNHPFSRHYVYTGITALEAVSPGLPPNERWSAKWNGLTGLPVPDPSVNYYYPANVNAAMAAINHACFPDAGVADKAAIDSLEAALNQEFLSTQSPSLIAASSQFGRNVATAVFNWAETDGYKNAGNSYTPPAGDGLWVPTPPAFGSAITPYWSANRPVIKGSTDNAQLPPATTYSTDPASPFYGMVKQVYDVSQNLTDEQKTIALFWRDIPGVSTPGHWLSILQQVVRQRNSALDKTALAYAVTGSVLNDAFISCFQTKYRYNLVRPVTYIRNVMGYPNWTPFLATPAHPEYSSAHAVGSAAVAEALQRLFGDSSSFTDHTYDYAGFAPRTFASFAAIVEEAGKSRLYAGIHYQPSLDIGAAQGRKVAANIFELTGLSK